MTCPLWEDQLNAFVDGELHGSEKEDLIHHLRSCAACQRGRELLVIIKQSVSVAIPCPQTPPELSMELLRKAAEIKRPSLKEPRFTWPLSWGLGLAFAAALIAFGLGIFQRPPQKQELSLNWILAAHNKYAMSLPLSQQELALPRLGSVKE
jgi:anti-sigma factor RsiW